MAYKFLSIFVIISCLLYGTLCIAEENRNPVGQDNNAAVTSLKLIYGLVTRADGNRCPMYPSCSHYGFEAIQKHGLLRGWFMTCDRLLRCGRDELRLSRPIIIEGKKYCHDPLSQNELEN